MAVIVILKETDLGYLLIYGIGIIWNLLKKLFMFYVFFSLLKYAHWGNFINLVIQARGHGFPARYISWLSVVYLRIEIRSAVLHGYEFWLILANFVFVRSTRATRILPNLGLRPYHNSLNISMSLEIQDGGHSDSERDRSRLSFNLWYRYNLKSA